MIITIDGTAGTGKTSVTKKVAEQLNMLAIDTGAMFRALAAYLLEKELPLCARDVQGFLKDPELQIQLQDNQNADPTYSVCGLDVSARLRDPEVTAAASKIATWPQIRSYLKARQQEIGEEYDCVFEGRDMGSTVFPNAELKVFLTASLDTRVQRRLKEILKTSSPVDPDTNANKNSEVDPDINYETLKQQIQERDAQDEGRILSPLIKPDDAFEIDTDPLSLDEVVNLIVKEAQKRKSC